MSTRAEAKNRTREALLLAALELFATSGLDEPSLDAICAHAGKTRGAFYVHFDTREALILAVVDRILRSYLTALALSADPADGLQRAITVFAELLIRATRGDPELGPFARIGTQHFRLVLEAGARFTSVTKLFGQVVDAGVRMLAESAQRGQERSTVRLRLEPEALGHVLIAVLLGLLAFQQGQFEARVTATRDTLISLLSPEAR